MNDCYYIAVRGSVLNNSENIALSDNRKLFAVYLEIGARVFRAQHFVAGFYLHFHFVSVYESAGADSHYNARLRFFLRGRGRKKPDFVFSSTVTFSTTTLSNKGFTFIMIPPIIFAGDSRAFAVRPAIFLTGIL